MACALRRVLWLCLLGFLSLAGCPLAHAASCPSGQLKSAGALAEIERAWATALEQRDTTVLGCILGEEFQDTDPEGAISDRAATLSRAAKHRPLHHVLSELSAHVYGDFGYIRGLATAVDAQGKTVARVRFTDIYVYRDQRWQAVAAHESMLPATPRQLAEKLGNASRTWKCASTAEMHLVRGRAALQRRVKAGMNAGFSPRGRIL